MCKEADEQLPDRDVKGLPPPDEPIPQPDDVAITVPEHSTELANHPVPEGPLQAQDLSEITESSTSTSKTSSK